MPALHIAARKDDVNAVGLLLNNPEVNVNHQAQHGFTPLHIAAHYGNVNVAHPLIEHGADVNFQAKNNITPLHIAAKWGRTEMVQLLLTASALVDCRTRDGLTPLHCAARSGHAELASLLIDAGANPSAKTRVRFPLASSSFLPYFLFSIFPILQNGLTPLHMAAQGNHGEVARLLIMRGASVEDKTGDLLTPLHVAAHCGNRDVARILLDNRCDLNARALNGFTPLHIACKKQKIQVVELLLHYGAQVDMITESGLSPLHVAAFIGSPEIVQMLLQNGAFVDQATMRMETALHLAARNRQVEVARALIHHGATVDAKAKDEQTPLHMAVLTGNVELVILLLSARANPNLPTRDAYTTMHIAAKEGHHEVIRLLLEAGASSSARTKKGFTPLHLASKRGRLNAARLLIQAQPKNVNACGQNNLTPLHVATHYNHLRLVELLLDHDADTNCAAGNGYTPLHIAAKQNHFDIATLLLAHESDNVQSGNAESRSGFTPLHLAAQQGHTDMVSLLLQHQANPNRQSKVFTSSVLIGRNGLAPLHLAAQENHVPVAQVLLNAGAQISPVTRAGYTPLHTACHFGQLDMVRFLLELSNAPDINQRTQMGFTPLHLATQQGHSQVVQLLLEMGADSNLRNQQGLTPAHIACKQHYVAIFDILKTVTTTVVSWEEEREELGETLILDHPDDMREHPVAESDEEGLPSPSTPKKMSRMQPKADESLVSGGSIGDQKIFITVVRVSNQAFPGAKSCHSIRRETSCVSNDPEYYHACFLFPPSGRTGTFSMGVDTTYLSVGENDDIWGQLEYMRSTLSDENTSEIASPQVTSVVETSVHTPVTREETRMYGEAAQVGGDWELESENVTIVRKPVTAGFLVSFLVDARGGLIRAQRYPDLRFIIPPNVINGPVRIVCRMLHPARVPATPPMNDGDGFACRLLELGPVGTRFSSPVVLEIPHYAFLTDKNREIVVLRSDNGEIWKEHPLDANDQTVQDSIDGYFDSIGTTDELRQRAVHRILTYDLPQYFALITRVRQELILIGPEGGQLTSAVVPSVKVQFPQGALHKKIRVGLQVHCIEQELVSRLLGARVSVSPIVTIEPRRRKFHKPIVLTMPLPRSSMVSSGVHSVVGSPSLRLLCSISGGTSPTVWEDITGSSPLSAQNDAVSFTTTVSARLWLVDCPNVAEVVELASRVYHESMSVPYIGRFIVYGRRHHSEEAQLRCLCLTDDSIEKTLEAQESFELLATGPQVESTFSREIDCFLYLGVTAFLIQVLDDHPYWIETAGNLVPVAKSEEQLQLTVHAFHENRLHMVVRVKDLTQPCIGKLAFMCHPRTMLQSLGLPQKRITVLETQLPGIITTRLNGQFPRTTDIDDIPVVPIKLPPKQPVVHPTSVVRPVMARETETVIPVLQRDDAHDTIARSELDLRQVASHVGPDWPVLALYLGLNEPDLEEISTRYANDEECAYAMLLFWHEQTANLQTSGTRLAQALQQIGRDDVLRSCMMNVIAVTSKEEREEALRTLAAAGVSGPRSESSGVGTSLDVTASQGTFDRGRQQSTELEEIVPVHVDRRAVPRSYPTSEEQVFQEQTRPEFTERVIVLQDVKQLLQEEEPEHLPVSEPTGAPVEEEVIVPESSRRNVPQMTIARYEETSIETSGLHENDEQESLPGSSGCGTALSEAEECLVHPTHYHRLGENEATWGRAPSWTSEKMGKPNRISQLQDGSVTGPHPSTATKIVTESGIGAKAKVGAETEVPAGFTVEEEQFTAAVAPRVGELESTWGKAQEPDSEFPALDVKSGDDVECLTSLELEGPSSEPSPRSESNIETTNMPEALVVPAPAWDVSDSDSNPALFDDIYDQALGELLTNRILGQPATSLTPIPEVSEYSVLSSSLASAHPTGSWDSGDLSPSGSMESRARASRRMLHQLLQQLRQPTDPEFSSTEPRMRDLTGNGDPKQRSTEGHPLDSVTHEPIGGSLHTRTSSSRSSLADFLRLETSCDSSRGDLSEEERQLISGQYDASLRDLVAGIQALQRQHLEDTHGAAALASVESSSGSHLAMGSGDAEGRIGAGHQEMTRTAEGSATVSLVASLMAAQMQQLIQSVSASSSSISSPPCSSVSVSSVPSHTTSSDKTTEEWVRDPTQRS
ncbi:Ankyrin-2 [Fasciola gigantica]|uniref:Ankyrin-2 n=1 Tax=Fasciola gigantica TaxID=46835 RepID=A0A504YH62_FASGI|nr:Ankyrin-2 [Fasciola gigantica]